MPLWPEPQQGAQVLHAQPSWHMLVTCVQTPPTPATEWPVCARLQSARRVERGRKGLVLPPFVLFTVSWLFFTVSLPTLKGTTFIAVLPLGHAPQPSIVPATARPPSYSTKFNRPKRSTQMLYCAFSAMLHYLTNHHMSWTPWSQLHRPHALAASPSDRQHTK